LISQQRKQRCRLCVAYGSTAQTAMVVARAPILECLQFSPVNSKLDGR